MRRTKVLCGRAELQVVAALRAARPVVEVGPLVAAAGDCSGSVMGSMMDSPKIIVSFGALRAFCRSPLVLTTNDRADVSGRNAFGRSA
jgi:hypothetical protein